MGNLNDSRDSELWRSMEIQTFFPMLFGRGENIGRRLDSVGFLLGLQGGFFFEGRMMDCKDVLSK